MHGRRQLCSLTAHQDLRVVGLKLSEVVEDDDADRIEFSGCS